MVTSKKKKKKAKKRNERFRLTIKTYFAMNVSTHDKRKNLTNDYDIRKRL